MINLHFVNQVIKLDIQLRQWKIWNKDGFSPSEPIFVASLSAESENGGVLLFSALDEQDEKRVLLIILDVKTFTEMALIEFQAVGFVPKYFHGQFFLSGQHVQHY